MKLILVIWVMTRFSLITMQKLRLTMPPTVMRAVSACLRAISYLGRLREWRQSSYRAKIMALILISSASGFSAVDTREQFKELTTPGTSSARRDVLVEELSAQSFQEVGIQAAQVIAERKSDLRTIGIGPKTDKPWMEEEGFSEDIRIAFAASKIWDCALKRSEKSMVAKLLAPLCLENRPADERLFYLSTLLRDHYVSGVKLAMEQLAKDQSQPTEIMLIAVKILVQNEEVDPYFNDMLRALSRVTNLTKRGEEFRYLIEGLAYRFSDENKKALVTYGFDLLSQIDDGVSGRGYFLASDLGSFVGVKPQFGSGGAFVPDQRLPKYQTPNRLSQSFFQDTVNNAQEWWRLNHLKYEP